MSDPLADGMNNGREIVGSATDAAVYTFTDGVDFFVRLRVDNDPAQGGTVRPFGWGLLLDTNSDFAAYEFALMIDGTGNPKSVVFSENTSPGTLGDPSDKAELIRSTTAVNLAPGGNVRILTANTSFNGTPDFFLDYAVPLTVLRAAGISLSTPLRVIAGTSSSGNSISVDVAGTGSAPGPGVLEEAASDPVVLDGSPADHDGDGVNDPADLDDDNDGILDTAENSLGVNPDGDIDGDGVPNWRDASDQGNGSASSCVDAGADGLCDAPSIVFDADRDGVPNHHDVDSDDDGIADVKEAGHRAPDTGGDGLVDAPHGANGYADSVETTGESGVPNYPLLDTDDDDIPDFLDLDSDGDGAFDLVEVGRGALDADTDGRIDAGTLDVDEDGLRAPADSDETAFGHPLIVVGAFDSDADGIPNPYDPVGGVASDSDTDGLTDQAECLIGWPCPDGDSDGTPNYMDPAVDTDGDGVPNPTDTDPTDPNECRDVDADTCDDCVITGANASGGNVNNDGADADSDGACDAGDTDDDNDGVLDGADSNPLDPLLCKDSDSDGCSDCAVTGANASGGNVNNDGADADSDGACDAGDTDDDNDGVLDGADSNPLDPLLCKDSDSDGCSDCAVTGANASGGNVNNDGADADSDGACDAGDTDSDNDGVPDSLDGDPQNPAVCRDTDADSCDDCALTSADGSGGDPLNDGADADSDGICDAGQDGDDDGVPLPLDADADNDGIPNELENLRGIDPLADADEDGIPNFADVSDRGDGQAADCVDVDTDQRCDDFAVLFDTDGDGAPNHVDADSDGDGIYDLDEAGHGVADTGRDGDLDDNVGVNGLVDVVELVADSGAIDYALSDVDGDSVPDFLDLDSDGDDITDEEEAGDAAADTVPVDSDGDLVPDYRDADSDGDTISDADEAGDEDASTPAVDTDGDETPDYLDDDTDGDGVRDTDEAGDGDSSTRPVNSDEDATPDFRDPDSDDDTVGDGVDNCRLVPNGDQSDANENGVGDACEGDEDGDGVPDPTDNCPLVDNSDQADRDEDGVGDACEAVVVDSDDDGVVDADDNCAETANPDQADRDGDGTGDACEAPPADRDDDGVPDADDLCPDDADADQIDRDQDGAGDACDRDDDGDGFHDDLGVQGGGCSVGAAGGRGDAWAGVLLAAFAAALAGRARRRRALARSALLGVSMAGLVASPAARAQETAIPAERFRLASTRDGILDVESGRVGEQWSMDLALWAGYANDPLTVYRQRDGERQEVGSLVGDRFGGAVVYSMALLDRFQLGLTLPLVLAQTDSIGEGVPEATPDSFGLGNLELAPKLQLLKQKDFGLDVSLLVGVMLPTTTSDDYFGDDGWVATPELAVSRNFGSGVHGALNGGYRFREQARLLDLAVDDEITLRAGVALRLKENGGPPLELSVSGSTATAADDPFDTPNRDYAEVLGGLAYDVASTRGRLASAWQLFAAGGAGLARGFGTPDFRALVGVRFALSPDDPPPPPPARAAPVDSDGDGLLDPADGCPQEPETKNGLKDDDGCPDDIPDTDGDGLRDPDDKCPQEPEDRDNFQDEDGCPEPDNDADGTLDAADRCPLEAGPAVTIGCPDPDRDKDTVVDRLDNCPDEPGKPELQGCNEKQLVRIQESSLVILEVVQFEYNKAVIQKRSFKLLDDVATVIVNHPELRRIRVEGHTDDRGNDAYNKKLSQARAESVVRYLTDKGVAAERLEAVGYGEEKPVADNTTDAGRTQNRRVEFKIVETKTAAP